MVWLRVWIELGFRALKSFGWHWERTRRTEPAARWRGTGWCWPSPPCSSLAVGTGLEDADSARGARRDGCGAPRSAPRRARARRVSVFARGRGLAARPGAARDGGGGGRCGCGQRPGRTCAARPHPHPRLALRSRSWVIPPPLSAPRGEGRKPGRARSPLSRLRPDRGRYPKGSMGDEEATERRRTGPLARWRWFQPPRAGGAPCACPAKPTRSRRRIETHLAALTPGPAARPGAGGSTGRCWPAAPARGRWCRRCCRSSGWPPSTPCARGCASGSTMGRTRPPPAATEVDVGGLLRPAAGLGAGLVARRGAGPGARRHRPGRPAGGADGQRPLPGQRHPGGLARHGGQPARGLAEPRPGPAGAAGPGGAGRR